MKSWCARKGWHKGVDKVAIVHGTQLHAPAHAASDPSTSANPISTPTLAMRNLVAPTALPAARSTSSVSHNPSRSSAPLGITKRRTPLDSKREISQTTRWQRCSCRELLLVDASTNLRGERSCNLETTLYLTSSHLPHPPNFSRSSPSSFFFPMFTIRIAANIVRLN